MSSHDSWLVPDWPAPERVRAIFTTRLGGVSVAPYDTFNLAEHVGDDAAAVARNRQLLPDRAGLPSGVQWLQQVHGTRLVEAVNDGWVRTADGCFSGAPGLVCSVMTADCLPVLFCDREGNRVAAAHAGWRGLAGGILRAAVDCFPSPDAVLACLGPAISQPHFEVGVEVLEAFYDSAISESHLLAIGDAFEPSRLQPFRYHADLYALARAELAAVGVKAVFGGGYCTHAEKDRFFSFRRDGQTGRMAALIWIQ